MKLNRLSRNITTIFCRIFGIDNIALKRIDSSLTMVRIGSSYGGWVVPKGVVNSQSICYCVGCGEDISFDLGLINDYGCQIYGFDPTPKSITYINQMVHNLSEYHFFELGLWDEDSKIKLYAPGNPNHWSHSALNLQNTNSYIEADVKRLCNIMHENSHKKLDLLKIDIEGAEYKVISTILEDKLNIKILCVEFDEWNFALDKKYKKRITEIIKSLIGYGYFMVACDYKGNYTFLRNEN